MQEKRRNMIDLWQNKTEENREILNVDVFDFNEDIDSLKRFAGTHPAVMQQRIAEQNWTVELDLSKKKFSLKDRLLYWFEKKTGIRLFDFKNYRII
jgi:aspartyl/asparaginyl beta-hydroxylase (cupin superfamily)